jgi:catechol 2,3-dioxygenase-like lactoylglutathione lyase family enzyme
MPEVLTVHPVLRIFDRDKAVEFYVDYAGFTLDWEEGEPDGPQYLQVSMGPLAVHLSNNHDDGTPGGVLVIELDDILAYDAELSAKGYSFLYPAVSPGPGEHMASLELIDPFSNRLRFFQRHIDLEA